jgi:hypothetical protein
MHFRRSIALAIVAPVMVAVTTGAFAGDKKPLTREESVQLKATVETIDQATRTLVLKGAESGERAVVVAGPDVRNLAQVKEGDTVLLTYKIGIAAAVKPKGTGASAPVEAMTAERSGAGQRPSATVGRTLVSTVKVDSVDTSFNTVTFTRADGITRTVAVEEPDAKKFIRGLKPGDAVEISYSEATAVSVEPAAAK